MISTNAKYSTVAAATAAVILTGCYKDFDCVSISSEAICGEHAACTWFNATATNGLNLDPVCYSDNTCTRNVEQEVDEEMQKN